MTTRTMSSTLATKTMRATRSRKPKALDTEEKAEDNETSDEAETTRSGVGTEVIDNTDALAVQRDSDVSNAVAEDLHETPGDNGATHTELEAFARILQRLEQAASRSDAESRKKATDGVRELAESLQQMTTQVINRLPRSAEERSEERSSHMEDQPAVPQQEVEPDDDLQVQDAVREALTEHQRGDSERQVEYPAERERERRHEIHRHRDDHEPRSRSRGRRQYDRRNEQRRSREHAPERHQRRQRSAPRYHERGGQPPDDDDSSGSDSSGRERGRRWNDDNGSSDESPGSESSYDGSSDTSVGSSDTQRRRRRLQRRDHDRVRPARRDQRERYGRRERRDQRERHGHGGRRDRREERERRRSEERGGRHRPRARNIKDLELPSFTPTPRASVSTWVDRIDLALKGARESGRGEWSDRSLYFILGNKLMESASRWWVNMDRRLHRRERTWTNLKVALLRRYGPRVDKSAAEARVNSRFRFRDEPYADFAAGLREAADRNEVSERVFLAQFYRCLDKTVRQLVKQPPTPLTLEEAVEKAIEIDDPMDYGVPTVMGANPTVQPDATSTMAAVEENRMVIIPGVGTLTIPSERTSGTTGGGEVLKQMSDAMAVCNNQQGIYNGPAGVYEFPPGKSWNGRYWAVKPKPEKKKAKTKPKADAPKLKAKKPAKRMIPESSSEEEKEVPRAKRQKPATVTAAVKRATVDDSHYGATRLVEVRQSAPGGRENAPSGPCFHCGQHGHWSVQCPNEPKCYACRKRGHYARDCPNEEAKKRNDEYLRKRTEEKPPSSGNENRA